MRFKLYTNNLNMQIKKQLKLWNKCAATLCPPLGSPLHAAGLTAREKKREVRVHQSLQEIYEA